MASPSCSRGHIYKLSVSNQELDLDPEDVSPTAQPMLEKAVAEHLKYRLSQEVAEREGIFQKIRSALAQSEAAEDDSGATSTISARRLARAARAEVESLVWSLRDAHLPQLLNATSDDIAVSALATALGVDTESARPVRARGRLLASVCEWAGEGACARRVEEKGQYGQSWGDGRLSRACARTRDGEVESEGPLAR
eukprot:6187912-Pleurochrysis_carterae.AAC.1